MSAENAWRIAKEAAAQSVLSMPEINRQRVAASLQALLMPPAFRAAVEAETERVKLAIARRLDEEADMTPCAEDAGVIRGCANLVRVDFSYDAEEALQAEAEELRGMLVEAEAILRQLHGALNSAFMAGMEEGEGGSARRQEKRMGEYEPIRLAARALLSRLEAKGESHE